MVYSIIRPGALTDEKGKGKSYSRDINNRINNGELLNKDSIKVVDSLQFKTPKGKIADTNNIVAMMP